MKQPSDPYYELKNGIFNFTVTMFKEMEQDNNIGRVKAAEEVSGYLHKIADEIQHIANKEQE